MDGFFDVSFGLDDASFYFELGFVINLLMYIVVFLSFLHKRLICHKKTGGERMECFFYCFGFVASFISVMGFVLFMVIE